MTSHTMMRTPDPLASSFFTDFFGYNGQLDIFTACYRTCTLYVDIRSIMIAYSINANGF